MVVLFLVFENCKYVPARMYELRGGFLFPSVMELNHSV